MDFNPPVYRSSLHLMHDMQREHDVCSETLICFVHSRGREMKKKKICRRESMDEIECVFVMLDVMVIIAFRCDVVTNYKII